MVEKLEKQIEKEILEFLNLQPYIKAWKNISVGVYDARKKVYRSPRNPFFIKGVSDILGIYQSPDTGIGRMLAVEVKRPKTGKITEHQREFIQTIETYGGIAFIATSVDEVKDKLNSYNIELTKWA